MNKRVLRWGLLSTAHINRSVIPPLRMSPRNELIAVASRDKARADEYARQWAVPRTYGSYEEMLAAPDIDVIYNSLPNSLHAHWTIKAMQAGKHVLCEKPIAISPEEVDAMAEAARKAGVYLTEAFMYRHHPQTLKVKELVQNGAIGALRLVRGAFTFSIAREDDIRLNKELVGGSIWDVGCYPISYTRYVVGAEPEEVFGWQVTSRSGVDETFTGVMRFPGNVYGSFDSGFRAPFRTHIEIVGSEGIITVPKPFKPDTAGQFTLTRGDQVDTITSDAQELYLGEVEDIADAILSGKSPRINLVDSRADVATIVALLHSAQSGQPVKL
ncbi:MAG: Gfo/Idh/MocA family oxidoreductase [Chloroflexi bacterium]|nr:Gfo/Idh/MocA family oxidoreductase [Chloroflexota bacterium]MCL5273752.1 Gfo/Idh/MocA family oxidoreductase [Chloroflexota bacterium]